MTHLRLPLIRAVPFVVVLQSALLVATGVGATGVAAGTLATVLLLVLVGAGFRGAGLGPADVVTLTRAVLVATVVALVADGASGWVVVGFTAVALALDGVDGQVARRTGTASAAGARFDMETDAVLLLVLSVHVGAIVGPWVLAIGLMRYAFVAAGWLAPWLQGSLPPSFFAKAVAAMQGVVLVVATAGVLPGLPTTALLATSLTALCWSFGRSVVQLLPASRTPVPRTA